MSMMGNFLLVSESEIAALLKVPAEIHAFLEQRLAEPPPNEYVDADKAWHILHFLLTGTAWEGEAPLNFIVRGGQEIGEEDVGYGPARALLPAAVVTLDAALEALPTAALAERYDPAQMAALEIYGASRFAPSFAKGRRRGADCSSGSRNDGQRGPRPEATARTASLV